MGRSLSGASGRGSKGLNRWDARTIEFDALRSHLPCAKLQNSRRSVAIKDGGGTLPNRKDVMNHSTFDRFVRRITEDGSRRGLLRSALVASVAGLGAVSMNGSDDAAAKSCKAQCNKKKNKNKRAKCKKNCDANNERCKTENVPCAVDGECCSTQNLVCDVSASSGDKKCCRGQGAPCSSDPGGPQCCAGSVGGREFQCFGEVCQDCSIGLCK
jgi:hypothetical protein